MIYYDRNEERTGVQESSPYNERIDLQCDFVMVYGFGNLKERARAWKKRGYVVHLMTGVSWGEYQDYLYGKFDGVDHHDEGQLCRDGRDRSHGIDIPYMVPSISFAHYLAENLKTAVDAGVEAIHLEEPEFWADTGYSDAFKREWEIFYKEPWQDPRASADGQYRASKLKQYLYTRTLDHLCSELKEYALKKYGRMLRFYVPTHSLVNYTQWRIVSPESALVDLPCIDGYIAQVWTGTARSANTYRGVVRERTFESAFLEYGIMQELVRGSGRKMWYLADPIEDDANHTWKDYRENYYRTVTASLFHPEVFSYEVAPWPQRVMCGTYPTEDGSGREGIPPEYATNLLTVQHQLRDMKQEDVCWETHNPEIGLLLADSSMYQRIYPDDDPFFLEAGSGLWNSFFGLALPLLKRGACVRPVQLDNVGRYSGYLNAYRVLVLSYEFIKPSSPALHYALSQWVHEGGTLIYVGDGSDSFHKVREWWNDGAQTYDTPAAHLFDVLGIGRTPADGVYQVGAGRILVLNTHPMFFAKDAACSDSYAEKCRDVMAQSGIDWTPSPVMVLSRGPYTITAVMDETADSAPYVLHGSYMNLYDHNLSVVTDPVLEAGSVGLWMNMKKVDRTCGADVYAASGRISSPRVGQRSLDFKLTSPSGITAAVRLYTRRPPKNVEALCGREPLETHWSYDAASDTTLVNFAGSPAGVTVRVRF